MISAIRAIAIDYDGTLTAGARPEAEVLAALREVRGRGLAVVLVTGRILSELRADFPEVDGEFDAIVAENGTVLADADGIQDLAEPVEPLLGRALAHREIPVRQGRVLLACETGHAGVVLEEITRLGLDCQVVRNRGALMVLPGGATKGSGLAQALGNLGISRHSTLAVGDAENDHHLLATCELGVAVGDAVDALKQRADLVLDEPNGEGVAALLRGALLAGADRLPPAHWRLTLGHDTAGNPVEIPASQVNVLLTGGSCSGKSHLAGLLIEQLVRLDYSALVIDREGDHRALADRRGILTVGGPDPLPAVGHLVALLRHRFGTVVLDLSQHDEATQQGYLRDIGPGLLVQRAVTGLPHWIVFEEAHTLGVGLEPWAETLSGATGLCYSTYRPQALPPAARRAVDLLVVTAGDGHGAPEALQHVAETTGWPADKLQELLGSRRGQALLVADDGHAPTAFTVGRRATGHVRHWHKYIDATLPERLRFYFCDHERVAANLREFHRHLRACPAPTITQHARAHDFSRWIGDVLQDTELARDIALAEQRLLDGQQPTETVRDTIQHAIEHRYLE
jgi:hydroxymethylpyrimidine pyrophosphatase-like HAD family hydrolase